MTELQQRFMDELELWGGPLGPMGSPEAIKECMRDFAAELDPALIPQLVAAVKVIRPHDEDDSDRWFAAIEFFEVFVEREGHAELLADAIVEQAEPNGPPMLVDLWPTCKLPQRTPDLVAKLDLARADATLVISVADMLGEVPGEGARETLRTMLVAAPAGEAREEVEKAIVWVSRKG